MKKCKVALTLIGVVVCFCSNARATLVDSAFASLSKSMVASEGIIALDALEQTTSTFVVTTTNNSSLVWTGYILSLDPAGDATFVEGTAGSTKFKTVEYPDPWTIEFRAPEQVPLGGMVALQYDVIIPEGVPYSFMLTQTPIPEPATVVLFGFMALIVATGRKIG
jgi:hypothetical protein